MKMSTYFNSLLTRVRHQYLGEEEWVQASKTQTVFAHALVSIIPSCSCTLISILSSRDQCPICMQQI
jgi:hypothetical protein